MPEPDDFPRVPWRSAWCCLMLLVMGLQNLGRKAARAAVAVAPLRRAVRKASLSGRVSPNVWKRLPVEWPFVVDVSGGSFRYLPTENDLAARPLYWRGLAGYECETLACWSEFAVEGGVIIDVGANTGIFTLTALAASPEARVLALEPVARVADILERNVAANDWRSRCDVRRSAASDFNGRAEFLLPDAAVPSSAHLSTASYRTHEGSRVIVETVRLDDLAAGIGRVGLVKIDVEGAENEVLRGMIRLLAEDRPKIVVECWAEGPYREVEALLSRHAYSVAHIGPAGPVPVAHILPDPTRRHGNFLCTPDG